MSAAFGPGERFKATKARAPGPGAYDPKTSVGFKADPKSSFLTGERFSSGELLTTSAGPTDISPPRSRVPTATAGNRKYSWATQRIHDLESELQKSKDREKELDVALKMATEAPALRIAKLEEHVRSLNAELSSARDAALAEKQLLLSKQAAQAEALHNMHGKERLDHEEHAQKLRFELALERNSTANLQEQLALSQERIASLLALEDHHLSEQQLKQQQLQGEIAALLSRKQHQDLEVQQCQQQLADARHRLWAADLERKEQERAVVKLVTSNIVLLVLKRAARSEIAELYDHCAEQTAQIEAFQQQVAKCQEGASSLAAQVGELAEELQQKMMMVVRLQDELQDAREQCSQQSAELQQAAAGRVKLQSALDLLQGEHSEMQVELVQQGATVKQLETELEAARMLVKVASDECSAVREENYQLGSDLDKVMSQVKAQEAQAEMKHAEFESMQAELSEAYVKLAAIMQHNQELEQQLEDAAALQEQHTLSADNQAQLDAALARAARAAEECEVWRKKAGEAETNLLEVQRLTDDNALLMERLGQTELDIKELLETNSVGLGHNNPRQKIQYHLRLKQELEELRQECTVLLRDKFQLEQCVRYLAVRASVSSTRTRSTCGPDTGTRRKELDVVQPASLAQIYMFTTPIGQKSAKVATRSKSSADMGAVHQGREPFESAIQNARHSTVNELTKSMSMRSPRGLVSFSSQELKSPRPSVVIPNERTPHDNPVRTPRTPDSSERSGVDAPNGVERTSSAPQEVPMSPRENTVESRILVKISQICSPSRPFKKPSPRGSPRETQEDVGSSAAARLPRRTSLNDSVAAKPIFKPTGPTH